MNNIRLQSISNKDSISYATVLKLYYVIRNPGKAFIKIEIIPPPEILFQSLCCGPKEFVFLIGSQKILTVMAWKLDFDNHCLKLKQTLHKSICQNKYLTNVRAPFISQRLYYSLIFKISSISYQNVKELMDYVLLT